jgi:hypothetical protein
MPIETIAKWLGMDERAVVNILRNIGKKMNLSRKLNLFLSFASKKCILK